VIGDDQVASFVYVIRLDGSSVDAREWLQYYFCKKKEHQLKATLNGATKDVFHIAMGNLLYYNKNNSKFCKH
jgi:hypothetical protein